jgi:hypothetical protein
MSQGLQDALPEADDLAGHRLLVPEVDVFYQISPAAAAGSKALDLLVDALEQGVLGWHDFIWKEVMLSL